MAGSTDSLDDFIAAPWREDIALRIAFTLEKLGAVAAPRPALEGQ